VDASSPAGWYPDPSGRHQHRYFDGRQWTEHVADAGRVGTAPVTAGPGMVPTTNDTADRIRRQVHERAGVGPVAGGGGTLFTEPVLVVNQKVKIIELHNEYAIFDQQGNQLGAVRQVGQSAVKKAARVLTGLDQFMTHTLQLVDARGAVQLVLTRPAKIVKSRIEVADGAGVPVGTIVQQNVFGKIRFGLEARGAAVGSINGENWRAWNWNVQDASGAEIARITKTWEGLARTLFTTADNYVVQIHRPLPEPLRSLVVAAAVSVDTALKQDSRGLS